MRKLTQLLSSVVMLGALSLPVSSPAADYIRESTCPSGRRQVVTQIHTEPRVFLKAQPFSYIDGCGCPRIGITYIPECKEVVTSKSRTVYIHPKERPCTVYVPATCSPATQHQQPTLAPPRN